MSASTNSNVMNNQVVASSSSQWISIVPENGEQFNPQQKIVYNIEPEIGYIKKDSYLVFDVLNNSASNNYYTFQGNAGIHAIIEDVNIYAKDTGVLLESIQNYNQLCSIISEYKYDDHTALIPKVGMKKKNWCNDYVRAGAGAPPQIHPVRPTHDNLEDTLLSPMSDNVGNHPKFYTRRFMLHLNSGLLGAYTSDSDENIIPVVNFGGLRIEINLCPANRCLELVQGHIAVADNFEDRPAMVRPLHNVVGGLPRNAGNVIPGWRVCSDAAGNVAQINAGAGQLFLDARNINAGATFDTAEFGIPIGATLQIWNYTNPAAPVRLDAGTVYQITATTLNGIAAVNGRPRGTSITITLQNNTGANLNVGGAQLCVAILDVDTAPSYRVMKTEYRLLQVVPPPNVASSLMKGLNYEFMSYETFLDNIPAATQRHQIPLNSVASKSVSVISHIYDSQNLDDPRIANPYFHSLIPQESLINSVVFFINNRLYPLRAYNPATKNDYVLQINEIVKSLTAAGLTPQKLGNNQDGNLESYTNNFLVGRELARDGFVFDLRNAEPEIRIGFTGARGNVLRANSFVFSKKIIQTTANGVQVIH